MKNFFAIIYCCVLSGCISLSADFQNPSGQTFHCQNTGWGLIGFPVAITNQKDCEKKAEEKGFHKLTTDQNKTNLDH